MLHNLIVEVIPEELRGGASVADRKSMQNDAEYKFLRMKTSSICVDSALGRIGGRPRAKRVPIRTKLLSLTSPNVP